ncbi:uncharacterized protein LOC129721906 isoform X2 [Wyeomyia smithii]|uniref:uncharacterized protein LOC129721906 isoform X2 n=1 Tax=Wyeomyia smithii TaxID=174621 RepID=UPI002467F125|nr:uncharacterized protein LOC129721906 isoform X2 [Wyeomyia smithii]
MLLKLHLFALFLYAVLKYFPKESISPEEILFQRCLYDTEVLCPICFSKSTDCHSFKTRLSFESQNFLIQLITRFDQHAVSYAVLDGEHTVVLKSLNRHKTVERLRDSVCEELRIPHTRCRLDNDDDKFLSAMRRQILDRDLYEGAIICPLGDDRALERFLRKFSDLTDAVKMILMRTNVQSLALKLANSHGAPVPKFIFQAGFTLVESFDGEALSSFYNGLFETRVLVAIELINAMMAFNVELDGFRLYLTDLNPDNIVVKIQPDGAIKVSFVDLNNVIILDNQSERLGRNNTEIMHTLIDCDGCFAYVQEEICSYHNSDINLFSICQRIFMGTAALAFYTT